MKNFNVTNKTLGYPRIIENNLILYNRNNPATQIILQSDNLKIYKSPFLRND